jgi:D-alanyl-D-alanine carboxypeptidase
VAEHTVGIANDLAARLAHPVLGEPRRDVAGLGFLSKVHPRYCTPFNATVFVGGRLCGSTTRSKQRRVIEGGSSEPPGPGKNAAGLALFRYRTRCGTVWGHTANTAGYTQFAAASPDGRRSVTVSVDAQLTPTVGRPAVFRALRRAEGLAVCAALAGR